MKIATLGPDVNESYSEFGVNKRGEIRFGLSAIKGMGEMAAQSIVKEREANGPFKDIYDFAQRIDFSNVNRKAFESLALSGGFDGFEYRREQYFAPGMKGDVFLDTLVRYGQLYQQEQREARNSLFGGESAVEISRPIPGKFEEWSTIERLNRERDLVGIYLSAHPLDEYGVILKSLCNTHCTELDKKDELVKKEEISIGGIVTGVKSKFTKTGKPCGFVTIEDFEGSGELAFFGEEWGRWRGMLTEDIQYMQTIKDSRLEKITISIDSSELTEDVVNDLATLVEKKPGKAQFYIQVVDREHNVSLMLRSRSHTVDVTKELISYVESNPYMSYHIN